MNDGQRVGGHRKALPRSVSGSAIVEMALVTPLLLLLVLGAGDYCRMFYWGITLSHAARAGAQYGAQSNGTTGDIAGIRNAALAEAQDIGTITVTSQRVCQCLNGTAMSCATGPCTCANGTCPGYGAPQVAVRVTATATFRTVAPFPGIPNTVPMSRTAEMRVQ